MLFGNDEKNESKRIDVCDLRLLHQTNEVMSEEYRRRILLKSLHGYLEVVAKDVGTGEKGRSKEEYHKVLGLSNDLKKVIASIENN